MSLSQPLSGTQLYACAGMGAGQIVGAGGTRAYGLFRYRGGEEWAHEGRDDAWTVAVAVDPRDPRTAYTATLNGCVRTRDAWDAIRVTTDWRITEPRDVKLDQLAPDTVYLALPDGLAVSSDGADTWSRREDGLPERGRYTQAIEPDRTTAGRVIIGCEAGLFLTEDAARSWRSVLATSDTALDVRQSPHDPQRWAAATQADGAWLSDDGGLSWAPAPGLAAEKPLYGITFDPHDPDRLAVCGYHAGVLTSEDAGTTWAGRDLGLPDLRVSAVAVDPDTGSLLAAVMDVGVFASADFGRTWQPAGLAHTRVARFCLVPEAGGEGR